MITKVALDYTWQVIPYIHSAIRGAGIGSLSGAGASLAADIVDSTRPHGYTRNSSKDDNGVKINPANALRGALYGALTGALVGPTSLYATKSIELEAALKKLKEAELQYINNAKKIKSTLNAVDPQGVLPLKTEVENILNRNEVQEAAARLPTEIALMDPTKATVHELASEGVGGALAGTLARYFSNNSVS